MPSPLLPLIFFLLFPLTSPVAQAAGPQDNSLILHEIADGVFVRPGAIALVKPENAGAIANVGFIVGNEDIAVIDTGGSLEDGVALRQAIRLVSDLPIRYVINTHVHPDHIFGNAAFLSESTIFVGHRRLPHAMAARGKYYVEANGRLLGSAGVGLEIVPPSLLVTDEQHLDLGGRKLLLMALPTAHTDNDLVVFDEKTGTLWAGDVLFMKHLPVIDGSIKGWLQVMKDLLPIPAARVVPGHGPVTAPWPDSMAPQEKYLTTLAEDLRGMIASGVDLLEASQRAGRTEADNWQLFEEFNARNATAAYAELEWE